MKAVPYNLSVNSEATLLKHILIVAIL